LIELVIQIIEKNIISTQIIFFKIPYFLLPLYEDISHNQSKTGKVPNAKAHIIIAQLKKFHEATLAVCIACVNQQGIINVNTQIKNGQKLLLFIFFENLFGRCSHSFETEGTIFNIFNHI
jgi:hypothetical protein